MKPQPNNCFTPETKNRETERNYKTKGKVGLTKIDW